MDKYEEFYNKYKNEMESRTKCFCSYGRGFIIFYKDEGCTKTILQFNVCAICEDETALNLWLVNFIIEMVNWTNKGYIFKTV